MLTYHVHYSRTACAMTLSLTLLAITACGRSHHDHAAMAEAKPVEGVSAAVDETPKEKGTIEITNFAFEPQTLTVMAGTKVVWINRDEEPHTVISATNGQFSPSPGLDTGDKYETTFSKPGTYSYFCSVHPHMVGKIIVQ